MGFVIGIMIGILIINYFQIRAVKDDLEKLNNEIKRNHKREELDIDILHTTIKNNDFDDMKRHKEIKDCLRELDKQK